MDVTYKTVNIWASLYFSLAKNKGCDLLVWGDGRYYL